MSTMLRSPEHSHAIATMVGVTALLECVATPKFLSRRYLGTAIGEEKELRGIYSEALFVLFI